MICNETGVAQNIIWHGDKWNGLIGIIQCFWHREGDPTHIIDCLKDFHLNSREEISGIIIVTTCIVDWHMVSTNQILKFDQLNFYNEYIRSKQAQMI